ncbi:L-type lectin-domain containing receptor kinase IX.1-like [Cucurbita maxima]|uniref:L-type lectin-domain containing receptor kinase IX.1-like n=1 Tax=Cucurbita maxima TaxID=3661 RepID=A0A6J1JMB6_CUCMA|nr:L-type lectin-domain containing receptor kinase IX.1-like [Cucurbita maxima]
MCSETTNFTDNLCFLLLIFTFFHCCSSFDFSFSSFPDSTNITFVNSAARGTVLDHPSIRLTDNQIGGRINNDTGRAYFSLPIQLWDPVTNISADFTTYFEFVILFSSERSNASAGGIAFFLASENSTSPPLNSGGGWLGLFNQSNNGDPSNQIVAVEFDIFKDPWDPSDNHVGVDVNSIVSVANRTWSNTMVSGDILGARITYNGTLRRLDVTLKDPQVPNESITLNLTDIPIDLKENLPARVIVGFSASTGESIPIQAIRSWNFTSSLDLIVETETVGGKSKLWVVGLVCGLVGLISVSGLVFAVWWRRTRRKQKERTEGDSDDEFEDEETGMVENVVDDEEFIKGTGPKRFSYKELVKATNNFSEQGKLGQGGFGGVYKGFITELNMEIAAKKISSNSKQGKKEYISEVNIIGRLRHRNLVQLVGYSHERGHFLLVYEYMPNGSLDSHLFGKKPRLSWPVRFKIAHGIASALLYLHEDWEQCVVHRDIKSSNIMLDLNFNAKVGDFGLARLVDHGLRSPTTVMAGTMGYLAPESFLTSKASKESDVYSFGVVALEIACGRKTVEHHEEDEDKISLVNWVWGLYGQGRLLEAADKALNGEFNQEEMVCLMTVGLWCAHPNQNLRASIRQAIKVLDFEAPLPKLPTQMPVPMFYAPSAANENPFSYTYSTTNTNSQLSL